MISLEADEETLSRYQVLEKEQLKVSTAVSDPNARGQRDAKLAWFWTMDVQRDTELNDWMSEFYRGHWLRAKALKDRWEEEVELLRAEGEWTSNFFDYKSRAWGIIFRDSARQGRVGHACYAARQQANFGSLRDHCKDLLGN
ncbi:hypothetical protein BU15DRAFT_57377 [Melanogaster broomeanus]|nr:hypothetical protein BU15DRAFT_57377 [Melanogaster broomeanus]